MSWLRAAGLAPRLVGLALGAFLTATPAVGLAGAAAAPPDTAAKAATARVMVSAANPLAVEAGLKVLRAGGGAVDAAVAIQAVLGLVEPQSSGIGGGGFMVVYSAKSRIVEAYDGREIAPAAASAEMFLDTDGEPLTFEQAVLSGRAAGTPSIVAMLHLAQSTHGRRPWRSLFGDAIAAAEEGFVVSPLLARFIIGSMPQSRAPDVRAYFTRPDGRAYAAGDRLVNRAYADTLRRVAARGPDALLRGPTAERIVSRLQAPPLPGAMTTDDLAAYRPKRGQALCRPYRSVRVCTPQPPSGGVAVLELLGILEHTDIASRGPDDPLAWYQFAQASRLMYADRDHFVGDPAFVEVPVSGLLDPAYTRDRAAFVGQRTQGSVTHGHPPRAPARAVDRTEEPGGTSSFVVADAWGDVVVMTTSVESNFGSGRMVDGFFLNNQLTDFAFAPRAAGGAPAANAVAPHKRPRSSMSPTIVLDRDGRLLAAIGSPGGPQIPAYVAKVLVAVIDWKLPMDAAIDLPNVVGRGERVGVEATFPAAFEQDLKARGLEPAPLQGEGSGLHGLQRLPDGRFLGAADRRREGVARGY